MPFLTLSRLNNESSQTLSRDSFQRRGKNAFLSMPTKMVMKLYASTEIRKLIISAKKSAYFFDVENFFKVWKEKILKFSNQITKI